MRQFAEVTTAVAGGEKILRNEKLLELGDIASARAEGEVAVEVGAGCGRMSSNRHRHGEKDHHQNPAHGKIVAPFGLRYADIQAVAAV